MDFVYDPVQAAQLTAWVQYVSPVKGVREEVAKIDPDLAENPLHLSGPRRRSAQAPRVSPTCDEDTEAEFDEAFASDRRRLTSERTD
ncbi:MAG: hypothetical protein WKF58_13255 [Ilumatobacteraceae bacterium]